MIIRSNNNINNRSLQPTVLGTFFTPENANMEILIAHAIHRDSTNPKQDLNTK